MKVRTLISLIALTLSGATFAEQSTRTPAGFDDGELSLAHRIRFPDVEDDVTKTAFCEVVVEDNGRLYGNNCRITGSKNKLFYYAIRDATRRSMRAVPAIVNGKPRSALFHYQVLFVREDGRDSIRIFPNWGYASKTYGPEYHAPQRLLEPRRWSCGGERFGALATNRINEAGASVGKVSFRLSVGLTPSPHCISMIRDTHEKAEYVPAHHNGKPVESTYVELWGDFELIGLQ